MEMNECIDRTDSGGDGLYRCSTWIAGARWWKSPRYIYPSKGVVTVSGVILNAGGCPSSLSSCGGRSGAEAPGLGCAELER
jgi:hypothetical protein